MNKRTSLSHVLAAILSGLLLAAAFPKLDQTWLLIFALAPLFWALRPVGRESEAHPAFLL
jgi:apolipoprotein N-acyltransferase